MTPCRPADPSAPPFLRAVALPGGGFAVEGQPTCQLGEPDPEGAGWATWRWTGDRLVARSCRYAIRPLYYCALPDRFMIAPSVATLLALGAPGDLDWDALAVYLRFENWLAEDTPFRAIRALPPDARLTWDGRLTLGGSLARPPRERASRAAAIDRYAGLFRRAVARLAGRVNVVPLSGGCDSRHIALELARAGALHGCVSIRGLPPKSDADPRIAGRVAAALGAPHRLVEAARDRHDVNRRAIAATGFGGREHAWFLPLADALDAAPQDGGTVFDGLGGDVLSAGLYLDAATLDRYRRGDLTGLARHYLRGHVGPLRFLADPELVSPARAEARLRRELERHRDAANPVAAFFFWNRTRRVVALQFFGLLRRWRIATPYLDHAVFDLLAALPAELMLDHDFHRAAVARAFPEMAALPYADAERKRVPRADYRRYGRAVLRQLRRQRPALLDLRHVLPRLATLAVTGGAGACWMADACLLVAELESAASGRAAAAQPPIAALTRGITCSAMSAIERRPSAGSTQSWQA